MIPFSQINHPVTEFSPASNGFLKIRQFNPCLLYTSRAHCARFSVLITENLPDSLRLQARDQLTGVFLFHVPSQARFQPGGTAVRALSGRAKKILLPVKALFSFLIFRSQACPRFQKLRGAAGLGSFQRALQVNILGLKYCANPGLLFPGRGSEPRR